MDNNNTTILNMEASLLQGRIKHWYFKNVGRDIALYNTTSNQEDTIQMAIRFTSSLFVALDLTGELTNCSATVKFLLANTLRMIERRAKLSTNNGPTSFIPFMRKKFTSTLELFRLLTSPEYTSAPKEVKSSMIEQVGDQSLFIWGESLLCFAECSLKFWKPQYTLVLKAAEDRLVRCVRMSPHYHQAHYTLGNVLLLQAKNEVTLSPPFLALVHRAKDAFFDASQHLHGVKAYNFNFIRACALLGQEHELSQLLPSFVATFPENASALLTESDFDHYRGNKWFHVLVERAANKNTVPLHSLPQPSPAQPLPPPHHPQQQPQHPPKPQSPQQQTQTQIQPPQQQQKLQSLPQPQPQQQIPQQQQQQKEKQQPLPITDPAHPLNNIADYQLLNSYPPPIPYLVYPDPYAYQPMSTIPPPPLHAHTHAATRVNPPSYPSSHSSPPSLSSPATVKKGKEGIEEKQYGALQSSLIESGFSIKRLLEVFSWLPVSSGILQAQPEEDNDYVKKQKLRLQQRLELYQLKPRREIPGDGNCQMHAISDQVYDSIERSKDVRKLAVDWLRKNKMWKLPNESILHEFVHDKPWEEYCDQMAKDGCWGDHLTLLALSELFGAVISIMSSVEGDNFITEIHPTVKKTNKVILLSHYAEFHYGSLTHIGETLK